MSIILKGNNISSSNKGIGPSEVTNIKASQNASSIILSWTNPSNVVVNGTTLSTFDHVIVVRNTSKIPNSEKDGTVVYNGKSTTCTDSSVTKNTKYYYRFFVYDTNKLCNNNMNMVKETTFYGIDPVLKNNTWDQINEASEAGIASSIWNIGDEIDLTLSGDFNETVTLQIWDFNHFDKTDGSGKAGICFGMKHLMKDTRGLGVSGDEFENWNSSTMKITTVNQIFNSVPISLQNAIKEVNTYSPYGEYDTIISNGLISTDKIFIPGFTEIMGKKESVLLSNLEKGQNQFPIFTNRDSRIKKLANGMQSVSYWWTRSVCYNSKGGMFELISDLGYDGSGTGFKAKYGICFCFNI